MSGSGGFAIHLIVIFEAYAAFVTVLRRGSIVFAIRAVHRLNPAGAVTKRRAISRFQRTERSWTVGRIGGFELTCAIRDSPRDSRPEPHFAGE